LTASLVAGTIALLLLAVFAFWPTYLSKPFSEAGVYIHIHATCGLAWLALLGTQALLISRKQTAAHRAVGRLSFVLAPLFVVSSVLLAHHRFSRMDAETFQDQAYTLYLPLSAAALFACAHALALLYRRNFAIHSRFMACTALLLVDPVLGRFLAFHVVELPEFWHYQVITFGAELAILSTLLGTVSSSTPNRAAFLRFAGAYATVLLLWFILPASAQWASFASWFRQLPLT
jgi:uncharacterized membrane protein YozB (DUF420 family)